MGNSKNPLLIIVKEVIELSEIIGVKKMMDEISELKNKFYKEPVLLDLTAKTVCSYFEITPDEFYNGTGRDDKKRFNARSVYAYILHKEMRIRAIDIANKIKCSEKHIYYMKNYIETLNTKLSYNIDLISKMSEIKKDIESQIGIKI